MNIKTTNWKKDGPYLNAIEYFIHEFHPFVFLFHSQFTVFTIPADEYGVDRGDN